MIVKGTDGKTWPETKCYKCLNWGHIATFFPPVDSKVGEQNLQIGISLQQGAILKMTQLTDTCSTDSCTNNKDLVKDLVKCKSGDELLLNTNGGTRLFDQKGLGAIIPVPMYYNKDSIGTIYAVKDVLDIPGARITFDSEVEKAIKVNVNGKVFKFEQFSNGLYGMVQVEKNNDTKNDVENYSMIQTVKQNMELFNKKAISKADESLNIQEYIGWPGTETYKSYINDSHINNCPVTSDDVRRARAIYGEPTPLLQGRMTRIKPITAPTVTREVREVLKPEFLKNIGSIKLFADIFYVNGNPFFSYKKWENWFYLVIIFEIASTKRN